MNSSPDNEYGFQGKAEYAQVCDKCSKIRKNENNDINPNREFRELLSELLHLYFFYIRGFHVNEAHLQEENLWNSLNRAHDIYPKHFVTLFRAGFIGPIFANAGIDFVVDNFSPTHADLEYILLSQNEKDRIRPQLATYEYLLTLLDLLELFFDFKANSAENKSFVNLSSYDAKLAKLEAICTALEKNVTLVVYDAVKHPDIKAKAAAYLQKKFTI